MRKYRILVVLSLVFILSWTIKSQTHTGSLTLKECLELAENNNIHIKILEEEFKIAKIRKSQASSARWPSLEVAASITTLDEDPNFIIPNFPISLPSMQFGEMSIPPLSLAIPSQTVKLADKQNVKVDLNFSYPLYTGGKISSIIKQSESGVGLAGIDISESKNHIRFEVKKAFYSALLTSHLVKVAEETLARLNVTLDLTESLYLNGSGTVNKTDYLSNKFVVESARSYLRSLESKREATFLALGFYTGAEINVDVELSEEAQAINSLSELRNSSLLNLEEVNFGYLKMDKIEDIFTYKIDEAISEHYPNLAIIGYYSHMFNKYDYGFVTPDNKSQWMIGVGLQVPIFKGFLISNKVAEAERQLSKFQLQKEQYRQGMFLKADILLSKLKSVTEELQFLNDAFRTATENRELSERAYQNEMLKIEELLQSQLLETFANINLETKQYELNLLYSEFSYIICN